MDYLLGMNAMIKECTDLLNYWSKIIKMRTIAATKISNYDQVKVVKKSKKVVPYQHFLDKHKQNTNVHKDFIE